MAQKLSHTRCFAHFGTKPKNVQWSWSARNEETKTVVVTLWQHEFKNTPGEQVYDRGPLPEGTKVRLGHAELMDNLKWSLDNCDGRVSVIVAIAKDKNAEPKSIKECSPTKMNAFVDHLDVASGAFRIIATHK